MSSIVALGAVTVGINLSTSSSELNELGLSSGSYNIFPINQMEELRLRLESNRTKFPQPNSGSSISNTTSLLARAGLSCKIMGIGGNDTFGKAFIADCENVSLKFLSNLQDDAITGYDFYLVDENGIRTIVWSAGANALLNPTQIDVEAIRNSELLLLDGSVLSYGPESEAAMSHCINVADEANVPFVLTLSSSKIVNDYSIFFETFASKAQMVAGNLEQASVLVGLEPTATLEEVRLELEKTPINALITLDTEGAFAKFGDKEFLVPTKEIEAIDSTGAGDAFLAAFILARKKGLIIEKSLAVGNSISGKVIQYKGARLPLHIDVPQLISDTIESAKTFEVISQTTRIELTQPCFLTRRKKYLMLYIRITLTVFALFFIANATAQEEVFQEAIIANPSFEFGWVDWVDVDPNGGATSISNFGQTDEKSAKITAATGHFEQEIEIFPDSDYVLRAVVRGPGIVTVSVDGTEFTAPSEGDENNWIPVEIEFSAGSATTAIIGGRYFKDEDARFDDYELFGLSGPALDYIYVPEVEPERFFTTLPNACEALSQLRIVSASDDGSNDGHTPEMVIDGNFVPESRWSSQLEGKELILDMGEAQILKEVGIAFYKGNERTSTFAIESSVGGGRYNNVRGADLESSGESTAIERFDFNDRKARYIKIIGLGNSSNDWNSFIEVQAFGCGSGQIASTGDGSDVALTANISPYGFKTNVAPAENFDLTNWKITLPIDEDTDGRADEISESLMAGGWADERFFYTDPVTGGMVFRVAGTGATTQNSSFSRTELREMLRAGDESIATRNDGGLPSANNWVFSAAPAESQASAGGVDGVMRATLSVNQVTRMGDGSRLGRVIIGQIHAQDGEPIRLYYRKLPTNKYGSVYYIHEREGMSDIHVPLIGDRSDFAENPDDGIALDEIFSYEIATTGEDIDGVIHPMLHVKIIRDDGTEVVAPPLDMIDSNYATANEFMYFKAGAYSQNISPWPERDFDQVTFFNLEVEH